MSVMAANSNFTCVYLISEIWFLVETLILFLLAFPLSSVKLLLMNMGQKATLLTFQLMFNQVKKRFMETIYFQVFILYSTVTRLFPSWVGAISMNSFHLKRQTLTILGERVVLDIKWLYRFLQLQQLEEFVNNYCYHLCPN